MGVVYLKEKSRDLLIEIGKRIAMKRNMLGYSQEVLAEKAGISAKTVSSAELGQKALRPENIIALSRALDMDIEYFLTGQYSRSGIFKDVELERLDADQLNALRAIVEAFLSACH